MCLMNDQMRKEGLLKEMGIEVWYLRPTEKSEKEAQISKNSSKSFKPEPKNNRFEKKSLFEKQAPNPVYTDFEAFKFSYLNSESLVLVFRDELTALNRPVLTDLVNSFELLSNPVTAGKGKIATRINFFEWPLVQGDGDPVKALSVFFDKYFEKGKKVVLCESAHKLVQPYLSKDSIYRTVPDVRQIVSSGESKKLAWAVLKSISK